MRREENLLKVYLKNMSIKKFMSNAHKKIKDVQKPLDEYEDESEVNYC